MDIPKDYQINYDYKDILLKDLKNIGNIVEFKANSLIEFEHKKLDYIYLINNGIVKQYFINIDGAQKTLLILSAGDIFGEITMIQGDYDQVITKAISNTQLYKIYKDEFYNYLKENPHVYNSILLMITTKFRILMSQIHDKTYRDTKGRLYHLLKRLSMQHGSICEYGTKIDLIFTHKELADMINSSRSTVTRLINELEKENKIIRDKRKIIISYTPSSSPPL